MIILILGEARHMIMPQNWHVSAKGNEGKENERQERFSFSLFLHIPCTYLIIYMNGD